MNSVDRLSALMSRFSLTVEVTSDDQACLFLTGQRDAGPDHITFFPRTLGLSKDEAPVLVAAKVDWCGSDNPLMAALPEAILIDLPEDPVLGPLAGMIWAEHQAGRCGSASVLNRLGEVLIVHLLRRQLENGKMQTGLVGGLSDPRLSRAIVAMHDRPGAAWTNADLAQEAGLSLSRFADLFRARTGMTPASYLRDWRLTLARQDFGLGHSVSAVARRYGYASPEALTHAYQRKFHISPQVSRKLA